MRLAEVCNTIGLRPGKKLRSRFVFLFGEMAGIEPARLELYAWAAEAIHTATLLHDDVIDRADTRRGGPSANALYDNTLPVLAGDYFLSDAVHQIALHGDARLLAGLCETLKKLLSGECQQYELRYRIPESCEAYREIGRLKTSSLFVWAALVGPTLAGSKFPAEGIAAFVEAFGMLFQYADDMLDLLGSEEKGRWVDLLDGTLNHAAWHLLDSHPVLREATSAAFGRREAPPELLARFERAVRDPAAFAPVLRELARLQVEAEECLAALPDSSATRALRGLSRTMGRI